jgi:hypothetical protein
VGEELPRGVLRLAEADGNRTRLVELLDHVGVEDRGGHQAPIRLRHEILGPALPVASICGTLQWPGAWVCQLQRISGSDGAGFGDGVVDGVADEPAECVCCVNGEGRVDPAFDLDGQGASGPACVGVADTVKAGVTSWLPTMPITAAAIPAPTWLVCWWKSSLWTLSIPAKAALAQITRAMPSLARSSARSEP